MNTLMSSNGQAGFIPGMPSGPVANNSNSIQKNLENLFSFTPVEDKNEDEMRMIHCYNLLHDKMANKTEQQVHEEFSKLMIESTVASEEFTIGFITAVLVEPNCCHRYFRDLVYLSRDGMNFLYAYLNQLISNHFYRLHENARLQLLWMFKELLRNYGQTTGVEMLVYSLLRHLAGGDLSPRNINLVKSILTIMKDYRSFYDKNIQTLGFVLFKFLRLIADHYMSMLSDLRRVEVAFCIELLRERFSDFMFLGRDLVRLLHLLSGQLPEFHRLLLDIQTNPKSLSPNLTGIEQLLRQRTPRRFLRLLITHELERRLHFMTYSVRFGSHRRYQEWMHKQNFMTPESGLVRADAIRYICCAIHPPNDVIASDVLPRWALILWFNQITNNHASVACVRLALFIDWIVFHENDTTNNSVMDLEPGMLAIFCNMRHHPSPLSLSLIDFLCRLPEFYPPLATEFRMGIRNALVHLIHKRVVPTLAFMMDPNRVDAATRLMLTKNWPDLFVEPQTIATPVMNYQANGQYMTNQSSPCAAASGSGGAVSVPMATTPNELFVLPVGNVRVPPASNSYPDEPMHSFSAQVLASDQCNGITHSYPPSSAIAASPVATTMHSLTLSANSTLNPLIASTNFTTTLQMLLPEHQQQQHGGTVIYAQQQPNNSTNASYFSDDEDDHSPSGKPPAPKKLKKSNSFSSKQGHSRGTASNGPSQNTEYITNILTNTVIANSNSSTSITTTVIPNSASANNGAPVKIIDGEFMVKYEDSDNNMSGCGQSNERQVGNMPYWELLNQIKQIQVETLRNQLSSLIEEKIRADQCKLVYELGSLIIEYYKDFDEREEEDDHLEKLNMNLTIILLAIFDEDMSQMIFPYDHTQPYSSLNFPNKQKLQESIERPMFGLFRWLTEQSVDEETRSPIKSLICEMGTNDPRISFALLYYLVVNETRMGVYRDYVRVSGRDFLPTLLSDLNNCAHHDVNLFFYLLPHVYAAFSRDLVGNSSLLSDVVAFADYNHIYFLATKIIDDTFKIFKKESISSTLINTLVLPVFEQNFVWQLLEAHNFSVESYISILPNLDHNEHATALFNLMLVLKRQEPSPVLVKLLLSREIKPGDDFSVTVLLHWSRHNHEQLAFSIGNFVDGFVNTQTTKRNKRTGNNSNKNPNPETILHHMSELKTISEPTNSKNLNFFSHALVCVALSQLKEISTTSQKNKYMELLSSLPSEGNESGRTGVGNSSNSSSSTSNKKAKKTTPKSKAIVDSETESSSSEDDLPQRTKGGNQRKKRKQPSGMDSD